MALAAGTSDRMLIYHFGSKENLIAQLLEHLSSEMAAQLDNALPPEPVASETGLIAGIMALLRSDQFKPYMRLWFDIVSAAAHGQTAHLDAARQILDTYLDWIARRHPAGAEGAPRALTIIEGLLVMDAVGCSRVADQAIARLSADTVPIRQ